MPSSKKTQKSRKRYEEGDWYDVPQFYDTVFDSGTKTEADFLEAAWNRFGGGRRKWNERQPHQALRILEPACGSGRLMLELAKRGHQVAGFDANSRMLEAAKEKMSQKGFDAQLWQNRFEDFETKRRFDLIHCLLSTFKYIQTEKDAIEHLRQSARQLVRGGLYVLGIHLTDYGRSRNQIERWDGIGRDYSVVSTTWTEPPNRRTRSEKLRNRLKARFSSAKNRPDFKLETEWVCRTYDAGQLKRMLGKIPELNCVACFDFNYDLASPRELDDSQEDVVLILVKS